MRRFHILEIHEQDWCPPVIRDGMTGVLQFISNVLPAYEGVMPAFIDSLQATRQRVIVDLCSGSGGPWHKLIPMLDEHIERITLTDLHPNTETFQYLQGTSHDRIHFVADSVDATRVPSSLRGFRTIFAAFHHFEPDRAKAVLQDAVDQRQGIAIFELTERDWRAILFIALASFIFAFVGTPFIRPFRWQYALFTYLIPIIPLVLVTDGIISCFRTYSPDQLRDMVTQLDAPGYEWHVGRYQTWSTPLPVIHLIGYPTN